MITYKSSRQLTLDGFHMPFGGKLNPENRWVKLSEIIPLDDFAQIYYCQLSSRTSRLCKNPVLLVSVYKPNKMKIISSLLLLLLVSITACQFNKPAITDKNVVNIPLEGIYKGTLPCADCAGIESRLILNRDKTFIYENTYIDKVDGCFTDRGSYTVKENIVTIQRNNTPIYFLIEENSLIFLGSPELV